MSSNNRDEDTLRLQRAVKYFLSEHGDNAIVEAEAALRYADQIGDRATVDVFQEVLKHLARSHSD